MIHNKKHLALLAEKCKEYHISLKLDARSYYFDYEERELGAPGHTTNTTSLVCGILHEMGHAIIDNHPFEEIRKSPLVNRFIIISLEYEAWKTGLEIMEELGLEDYRKDYIKDWIKCWKKYIDLSENYTPERLKFLSESISPR